ncbi:MAG: tRNA (adenosine(37)-N6)-threonylcarbamoyltransferase complex transferase subunit TsaD [bacterium]
MRILSVETSCDETAISIIEASFGTNAVDVTDKSDTINNTLGAINQASNKKLIFKVLGNALYSQAETHADFGGVFPTLAKREHIKNFTPILISALLDAGMLIEKTPSVVEVNNITDSLSFLGEREQIMHDDLLDFFAKYEAPEIDAIAVTVGPGLEPALWVGISGAKALAYIWQLPIIPVNHMEGHITSVLLDSNANTSDKEDVIAKDILFPAVALLISGGHTELVQVNGWGDYKLLGQTRDDAVGEAFDKVARIIGLKYPGGPKISALAKKFRDGEFPLQNNPTGIASIGIAWNLPRPMITKKDCDFSFSGLKTSVLYAVRDNTKNKVAGELEELTESDKASLCAEFEQAVTDVLISKTKRALEISSAKTLIIGGGVSANTYIKESFVKMIADEFTYANPEQNVTLLVPEKNLSTDNSLMIGIAGFLQYSNGHFISKLNKSDLAWNQTEYPGLRANGNLGL